MQDSATPAPRVQSITYPIPSRALDNWWKFAMKRSTLVGGATHYTFRFRGSTCTNCGKPIESLLHAVLRPGAGGMTIEQAWVEFDEEDEGHPRMCEYNKRGKALLEDLKQPAAFCGQALEAAIAGLGEVNPAGCFCTAAMVNHKWRQMLCAIHYGLMQAEKA